MSRYILSVGLVVIFLMSRGCGANPEVQLVEISQNTVVYDEIIRLNNCGGKGDSEQTATREFATSVEFGTGVSAGYQSVVQGTLSAKYSEHRNTSKSQRLVAPPGTNMEFVLRWSDDVRAGNVQVNRKSGTYEVRIPISVEQISSRDLGCGVVSSPSPNQTTPPSTQQTMLTSPSTKSPNEYVEVGFASYHDKQYDDAIAHFTECITFFPSFAECYHGLGMTYREIGDFEHSIQNHNKAIELIPRYDFYLERGVTYHQLAADYDRAIQDFKACIEKNSGFCNCYGRLGMAYRDKGDFMTAIPYHNEAIALCPTRGDFYWERGVTYQRMGNNDLANSDFDQARELGYGK